MLSLYRPIFSFCAARLQDILFLAFTCVYRGTPSIRLPAAVCAEHGTACATHATELSHATSRQL